jgi:transcriptional regulator with XRE-family HTH domain
MSDEKSEGNLVKKTCKELGITQKELAEMLEVSQDTVTNWSKNRPKTMIKTLLEALIYKKRFEEISKIVNFQIKSYNNPNFS